MEGIVNRVANSKLKTLDLENYFPKTDIVSIDMVPFLFQGLILKEKDYRNALAETDWSVYTDKVVTVYSSNDAIIPVWAYALLAKHLSPIAKDLFLGSQEDYLNQYYKSIIDGLDVSEYTDQMVVVKGCSNKPVPPAAYAYISQKLVPIVKSLMYGEPCSTVPIYKKPKNK